MKRRQYEIISVYQAADKAMDENAVVLLRVLAYNPSTESKKKQWLT